MADFFEFEADFVDSLRCIPMQVRYKLDICGIKLKLSHWHQMTKDERAALAELPCTREKEIPVYQDHLQQIILQHTGNAAAKIPIEADPLWMDVSSVPASIQEKAQEMGISLTLLQWASLTPLQRFALIKLSRSGHENKNFSSAMTEFNLMD